jgi:hypothetical protein
MSVKDVSENKPGLPIRAYMDARRDVTRENKTDISYVIYASYATDRLSQEKLLDLLKLSRHKNDAAALTGMLLYRDGTYLQFLEGRLDDIEKLLQVLRGDPRHKDMRIVRRGSTPERLFPEWTMAYKNLTGLKSSHVPGYSERLQGQYVSKHGDDPAQLLTDLFHEILITA